MVKVLICGEPLNNWSILLERVNTLHHSAHGPFHILLVCGKAFQTLDDISITITENNIAFSIPTYIYDYHGTIDSSKISLPENLFLLQQESFPKKSLNIGLCTLSGYNLTIGFITSDQIPTIDDDTNDYTRELHEICQGKGYRGCDILLTSDWPKDTHQFLPEPDLQLLQSLSTKQGIYGGSKIVSDWANVMRPRYHVTSAYHFYYQRPPYRNLPMISKSGITDKYCIYTRFISLGNVSESKEKDKKWLHALSIEPIINIPQNESKEFSIDESPSGTTENPYVSIGSKVSQRIDENGPILKRLKLGDGSQIEKNTSSASFLPTSSTSASASGGSFFFGTMGYSSKGKNNSTSSSSSVILVPPKPDAKELYIGGLTRDTMDIDILTLLPGSVTVKRPPGKAYAFVEFDNHQSASKIVNQSAKRGFTIRNHSITIGWAGLNVSSEISEPKVITDSSDSSSKTLFVGGLPSTFDNEELLSLLPGSMDVSKTPGKSYAFVTFESKESAEFVLNNNKEYPVHFHGQKLGIGWAKGNTVTSPSINLIQPNSDSKTLFVGNIVSTVTIDDIQSIFPKAESIRRPEGKDFAFIEFSTPDQARDIVEKHNSKDQDNTKHKEYSLQGKSLLIGWAQGKSADKMSVTSHAGNCWFCLASPTVAVHLVVSVGNAVYLALPKGGVIDFHVLIIPIDCIPSRIHLSAVTKMEFQAYESSLHNMFYSIQHGILYYERAIRTKGRDHMQEHAIPIPMELISGALGIFTKVAQEHKLSFHEIQDDRDVDEVVMTMEGGPYQEYFYISIPISLEKTSKPRRFVYIHEDRTKQFQMYFGSEVVAKILKKPERANWKNCMLSEDQENELAERFRNSYETYDFTLKE